MSQEPPITTGFTLALTSLLLSNSFFSSWYFSSIPVFLLSTITKFLVLLFLIPCFYCCEWLFHFLLCKALWITTVYEMCYINKLALPCLTIVSDCHINHHFCVCPTKSIMWHIWYLYCTSWLFADIHLYFTFQLGQHQYCCQYVHYLWCLNCMHILYVARAPQTKTKRRQ